MWHELTSHMNKCDMNLNVTWIDKSYEQSMSRFWKSHASHVNESCLIWISRHLSMRVLLLPYEQVTWTTHVSLVNESCHIYETVNVSHFAVSHMNESSLAYDWVIVKVCWYFFFQMDESCLIFIKKACLSLNESCHAHERVIANKCGHFFSNVSSLQYFLCKRTITLKLENVYQRILSGTAMSSALAFELNVFTHAYSYLTRIISVYLNIYQCKPRGSNKFHPCIRIKCVCLRVRVFIRIFECVSECNPVQIEWCCEAFQPCIWIECVHPYVLKFDNVYQCVIENLPVQIEWCRVAIHSFICCLMAIFVVAYMILMANWETAALKGYAHPRYLSYTWIHAWVYMYLYIHICMCVYIHT